MRFRFPAVIVCIVLADQLTKLLARIYLAPVHDIPVLGPLLHLTYAQNTGAGFSLFQDMNGILLFINLIIIGLLLYFFYDFKDDEKLFVSFIIAGATGNIIDRIFLGHVVDFIQLPFWPIFNIGDSAVTVGVVGLLYITARNLFAKDIRPPSRG